MSSTYEQHPPTAGYRGDFAFYREADPLRLIAFKNRLFFDIFS